MNDVRYFSVLLDIQDKYEKNNRCYKPHTNGTIPPQFGLRLPKKCFPSINCIPISGMQPNREKNIFCNREVKNQKKKHYNNNNILLWKINRREIIVTMNWAIQLCVAFFFSSPGKWPEVVSAHESSADSAKPKPYAHPNALRMERIEKGAWNERHAKYKRNALAHCVMCIGHNNRCNYGLRVHRIIGSNFDWETKNTFSSSEIQYIMWSRSYNWLVWRQKSLPVKLVGSFSPNAERE